VPRFDFSCDAGHVFTEDVPREQRTTACACGKLAVRLLSVPYLPGVAAGVRAETPRDQRPLKIGAFQEAAAEVDHQWNRLEQSAGRPLTRPNYLGMAKNKAQEA